MNDDAELLRRYAEEGAQDAFAELVHRHLNFVYSAALRQVNGDAHLAADAAQLVFADLARKAQSLAGHRVLAGWLFTSTRYAAAKLVRGEQRRRGREQEAFHMGTMIEGENAPELDWQQVRPVIDAAMEELGEADREAVLLRYFEGRDYESVGARLNLSPNTARMRVERALDKLRARLERRGVTSTSAALAAALAAQAVSAAPTGLAAAIAGSALAGGAAATGATASAWAFMSMTKLQIGVASTLAVAGAGGLVLQAGSINATRAEIAALQTQNTVIAQLQTENAQLAQAAAEVADLRRDDAQLAQLRDEAAALQVKWRALTAAEAEKAARAAAPRPLTGEIFDLAQLSIRPVAKFQAKPVYPQMLRRTGLGGSAVVEFVVDREGAVRDAKAIRSSIDQPIAGNVVGGQAPDGSAFAAAAVEAVSQWKFAPAEKDGRKVNVRLRIPIVFTLSDKERAGPAPTFWF